jgi:hypothetical protein
VSATGPAEVPDTALQARLTEALAVLRLAIVRHAETWCYAPGCTALATWSGPIRLDRNYYTCGGARRILDGDADELANALWLRRAQALLEGP